MTVLFTTRSSGESGPVAIWYDVPGGGRRKVFSNGFGRAARAFYAAKSRAGKNPRVVKADAGTLFDKGDDYGPDDIGLVPPTA